MKNLELEDCLIMYRINTSEMMNMTVLTVESSNNHTITIKITKLDITDTLEEIIKQSSYLKGYVYFILNLIMNINKAYDNDIISIMVDGDFLHIDQLSSNLIYSCKGV